MNEFIFWFSIQPWSKVLKDQNDDDKNAVIKYFDLAIN